MGLAMLRVALLMTALVQLALPVVLDSQMLKRLASHCVQDVVEVSLLDFPPP